MIQEQPISFGEAINETPSFGSRAVLLGNGFSIAQTGKSLTYSDLLEISGLDENSSLRKVFYNFDTVDFEKAIEYLYTAAKVAQSYGKKIEEQQYLAGAKEVREQLIEAIQAAHPPDFDSIPPREINSCGDFLKKFSNIFTLNYDLLLYWVLNNLRTPGLISPQGFNDGFGLGAKKNGLQGPFSTKAHCNVYNVHGGLHLFQRHDDDVYKAIANTGANLLNSIETIISQQSQLPLYVAEGTSKQKLAKIRSVPYLNHCLEELQGLSGALFVFGHSGDSNDEHIYDAIFKSEIEALYFCIYDFNKFSDISGLLQKCKTKKYSKNIPIKYIDVGQMNIWGKP